DRTLNPRPLSRNSPARGVRRPPTLPRAVRGGRHDPGPAHLVPSTHRNILAGLEQRHYAPSRVTVKLGDRCQAGPAPISRPSSSTGTRTTSRTSGGGFSFGLRPRWSRIRRIATVLVM